MFLCALAPRALRHIAIDEVDSRDFRDARSSARVDLIEANEAAAVLIPEGEA
jgi:hypothetical protein